MHIHWILGKITKELGIFIRNIVKFTEFYANIPKLGNDLCNDMVKMTEGFRIFIINIVKFWLNKFLNRSSTDSMKSQYIVRRKYLFSMKSGIIERFASDLIPRFYSSCHEVLYNRTSCYNWRVNYAKITKPIKKIFHQKRL